MTPAQEAGSSKFFVPLESLRGIAALVVIIFHAEWVNPLTALRFFQNGPLMVDLFFVLSGFVIFYSYGKRLTTARDVVRFLWLRLGRLYPIHFTFLLVFIVLEQLAHLAHHEALGVDLHAVVTNLLLVHSLGLEHTLTYNYPSWSISTELYNYVLFALVAVLTVTVRRFIALAAIIVAASVILLLAVGVVSLADAGNDWGFFRCSLGFFTGTLSFLIYSHLRNKETGPLASRAGGWLPVLAVAIMLALLMFANPEGRGTYWMPFLSAFLIVSLLRWPSSLIDRALHSRPLQWLGRISYSVYMSHAAVVWTVKQILGLVFKVPRNVVVGDVHAYATSPLVGLLILIAYVATVLALSTLTFRFIEAPFRDASRRAAGRWFAKRPDGLATAVQ
jgi:peptidoglycan/LPS O-acetylase OafA/YrhL